MSRLTTLCSYSHGKDEPLLGATYSYLGRGTASGLHLCADAGISGIMRYEVAMMLWEDVPCLG